MTIKVYVNNNLINMINRMVYIKNNNIVNYDILMHDNFFQFYTTYYIHYIVALICITHILKILKF